jgi:pyruvate dehydrogenase E1 component alpha subunit
VVSNYREHGHALARGVPMGAVMAEMLGKVEGTSRGRGGSMHLFDVSRRFYGGCAIVAAGIPLAVGLALADAMSRRARLTACFFGDGAVAEGEFHESLNLAALWRLPVLFRCENNLYAMGTAIARHQADLDLTKKAAAYGVGAAVVDGMDVEAVERAVALAAERVRRTGRPLFVELKTYRFRAHSMFDAELYRRRDEVREWMKRDPIAMLEERMRADGQLDDAGRAAIEEEVLGELDEAVRFAEAGRLEPVEELTRRVSAEEAS